MTAFMTVGYIQLMQIVPEPDDLRHFQLARRVSVDMHYMQE